jgi:hypothetical protein
MVAGPLLSFQIEPSLKADADGRDLRTAAQPAERMSRWMKIAQRFGAGKPAVPLIRVPSGTKEKCTRSTVV